MQRQSQNRRLRRNRRRFRKKRVDYSRYVRDFYLQNGLAYISCNVKGYEDVISRYSVPGYEWLNPELAQYLEENTNYIPIEYPVVLELCGVEFSPRQQDIIQKTVTDYYSLRLGDCQISLKKNRSRSWVLLILSLLAFLAVWVLDSVNMIDSVLEPVLIIFWFFLWEFGDNAWFDQSDIRDEMTEAAQLASIKVIFRKEYRDTLDPKTEEKIENEIYGNLEKEPL